MARRKPRPQKGINQIEGQMSLWDIKITINDVSVTKIKENITEISNPITRLSLVEEVTKSEKVQKELILTDKQQRFLEKNKVMENESLSRITLLCSGSLLVEFIFGENYKTICINKDGVIELSYDKRIALIPMDKIIYYKDDMKPNELQEEKLLAIQDKVTKVLKRKGDENIIAIAAGKGISINKQGWVLEYKGVQAVYDEEDVRVKTADDEIINEDFKVGESVEVEFNKKIYKGVITRIYNGGDTINCIFDNKHTAFHRSKVRKVKYV